MKKLLQAASVAGLVLFGAVGCSNCCGSKSTSAAPCATGQCATTTPTTSTGRMMTSGTSGTATTTTLTPMTGKPPMMSVNQMPASGSTTVGTSPGLMPQ